MQHLEAFFTVHRQLIVSLKRRLCRRPVGKDGPFDDMLKIAQLDWMIQRGEENGLCYCVLFFFPSHLI